MTDISAKHLDGAGLSHVFGKIKGALDNRMNDSVEYLYRAVNATEGAPSGLATIDSIHGNTLRWNQLCKGVNSTIQVAGVTKTVTSSGGLSAHGTVTTTPDYGLLYIGANTVLQRDGRKYLFMLSKDVGLPIGVSGYGTSALNYRRAFIWSNNSGGVWNGSPVAYVSEGDTVDFDDVHASIFDLTTMFGAGNEPATVAEFEALYPEPYYPYDPGSLLPVRMEGVETVGFNQWDEQTADGYWNDDGTMTATPAYICCKNKIPVFPGQTYYIRRPAANINIYLRGYDADGINGFSLSLPGTSLLTIPDGVYFIAFAVQKSQYGTTYNNDICINISDPARNGTYEPYWSSQCNIPTTELRSAGSVYDELRKDEHITRVGEVDLGTLNWSYGETTSGNHWFASQNSPDIKPSASNDSVANITAALAYSVKTPNQLWAGNTGIGINAATNRIIVVDPSITSIEALKASLSGKTLFYELATHTVTPIDPPLSLRYKVDSDGTERIMVDERKDAPQSAPVPMNVTYGISLYDSAVDDGMNLAHVRDIVGEPNSPYTEVEWVESDGTQFVYLDWKPPIATWGFEADFIIRNAFSTSVGAWRSDTNANGYGNVFGTRNASMVNDVQFGTYDNAGVLRNGTGSYSVSGILKTDKTRQTVSYRGTSLKRGDGTTVTFARTSETANKYYANMVVFAMHEGVRRSVTGNLAQPGTVRIYSLKFYDGTTLKVDLVGAIRNRDGMTGLYDKVKGHFYPAQGMTYGAVVGDLGEPDTVEQALAKKSIIAYVDNRTDTRMLRATVPSLDKLDDGQQVTVVYSAPISGSVQTTELAGWDDTAGNGYIYLKLTLADGSQTEWLPCYFSNNGRLTSHYGSGTPVLLTYREDVFINASTTNAGTSVMRGWWANPDYNSDDVYTRYSDTLLAGLNGVKRYSLNMRDANGNWTSIMNQDNNTGATGKTAYTGGLMLGNILYHNSGSNIAAGGNTGQMKESHGGVDFRYDVNGVVNAASTELQFRRPVYLVGTVHSDGLFYLDQTKWWTQTSFETGKVYVHVGTAYSSYYAIFLSVNNPSYVWDGSKLVEFDDSRIRAAESKLSGIAAGAEVNQNAFSNVKVGSTTVAADAKTDTLELVGSNVTLTPDATNDKVTIGITASNVTTALGTLPVANGGTGQTSLAAARNAMGLGNTTGALPVANGGTGATSAANARTNLGVPPTSHASSGTTYGTGTDANYGHVKLSGATNSTSGTSGGIAATPSAVKTAYDLANTANGTANTALSGVNGTLIYDHTYTIANGVATFTAHVYCKGEEVTSNYQDSAFSWSYRLSDAISETGTPSVVSLGTGKTKTINITTLGLGGHVIGTFTTD